MLLESVKVPQSNFGEGELKELFISLIELYRHSHLQASK